MTTSDTNPWQVVNILEKTPLGDLHTVVHSRDGRRTSGLLVPQPFSDMHQLKAALCSDAQSMQRRALALCATLEIVESVGGTLVVYDTPAVNSLKRNIESRLLPFEIALDYTIRIAEAIRDLHAHGIVHGALSLEQVILAGGDTIRIIGYGLSPAWGNEGPTYLPYLDPCSPTVTSRDVSTDLYALGIMMYRIATGQFPFEINSVDDLKTRRPEPPPAIGKRSSNWPIGGFDIIKKATSLNPAERFQTATEFRNALTRLSGKSIQILAEPTLKSCATKVEKPSLISRLLGRT